MFPKPIALHRGAGGSIGGFFQVGEDSLGNYWVDDDTTIVNPDPDDSQLWELNSVEQSLSTIRTTPYTFGATIRTRLFNSYFNVYTSYSSETTTALDTGGLTAKSATLASAGSITIGSISYGGARDFDFDITVPGAMLGETVEVKIYGDGQDNNPPFGTFSFDLSEERVIGSTTESFSFVFPDPGGSGSYFGTYTVEAYLKYTYPDGPFAQGNIATDTGSF